MRLTPAAAGAPALTDISTQVDRTVALEDAPETIRAQAPAGVDRIVEAHDRVDAGSRGRALVAIPR